MVMTHAHAKGKGQRSFSSKVRVETDGWADGGDCITSSANTVGNYHSSLLWVWLQQVQFT